MGFTKLNDEVYVSHRDVTLVTREDIDDLKRAAARNESRKARLCVHGEVEDRLHEMLIVHVGETYVPPHKHPGKSESFHIIEGRLKVFLFDNDGNKIQTVQMDEPASGETFFYRLSSETYHSVLPESKYVVFHEVTNGPFDRNDMVIAPWAPSEDETEAQATFIQSLLT